MDAAVAQAGHDTLSALYTTRRRCSTRRWRPTWRRSRTGRASRQGIALGKLTAANILAARANDGSQKDAVGQPVNYVYGTQLGDWQPDPLAPRRPRR